MFHKVIEHSVRLTWTSSKQSRSSYVYRKRDSISRRLNTILIELKSLKPRRNSRNTREPRTEINVMTNYTDDRRQNTAVMTFS